MSETAAGILIGGTVFAFVIWGFIGWLALRRYRRPEREPAINYDALQNELDEEFAPLPVERAARLSA